MSEAGGIVASTVGALKQQPLVLALVIMNLALLGFLYYTGIIAHDERSQQAKMLSENRTAIAELLSTCGANKL
jgi:hypothetical protein